MQVWELPRSTGGRRINAAASNLVTLEAPPIAAPTRAELRAIHDAAGDVEGWDFRGAEPVPETEPWDWDLQVRAHVTPTSRVLDIGTGGGEVFREYAGAFALGLGVDRNYERIGVAQRKTPEANLHFAVMDGGMLAVRRESIDTILARCADYDPIEVYRVLRPGGVFITLQMAEHDTQNVFDAFRWRSYGRHWRAMFDSQALTYRTSLEAAADFQDLGCTEIRYEEYDVTQHFRDVASLVLFLKASPLPERFDPEQHYEALASLVSAWSGEKGIETNAHRELLVVTK
jgi:ubiquinone/menaquinone biosynthesis C-methylase UbiE